MTGYGTAAVLAAAAIATGCAAARKSGLFAGLSSYDAGQAAASILTREEGTPGSPLYGKELAVVRVDRGSRPDGGGEAWVASLQTFSHRRASVCIFVWGRYQPLKETDTYDVDRCPSTV